MKLSAYAERCGVTYRTAFRWWQNGQSKGFQKPSGTISVTEGEDETPVAKQVVSPVVISARVSSPRHQESLERHVHRLEDSCAARGYPVGRMVTEGGSGVNARRRKFLALLADPKVDRMVVEQPDRAARVGFHPLEVLLSQAGRATRVANLAERNREDLVQDLSSLLNTLCASLYGPRRAHKKQALIGKILANGEEQQEAAS
jgi:predicted site-specific integrase-resolvase